MSFINIEIKAKSNNNDLLEQILLEQHARYIGEDHQIDTYFEVPRGRLKLREGNIESALIHYDRSNKEEAKKSTISYYKTNPDQKLKKVLLAGLNELVVVDKKRKIFFIENVKFHLDQVKGLGTFMEIEAIDQDGSIGEAKLQEQCAYYIKLLNIQKEDFIAVSYSDLLLEINLDQWFLLANSTKQAQLQIALQRAKKIAPKLQQELAFWLLLNNNLKAQQQLFSCLDEEHQELVVLDKNLVSLNSNKSYWCLAQTDDFIVQKIIIGLQEQEGAKFQQKVKFVNDYMQASNCSIETAKALYEQLTIPKTYPTEVERWTQLASSPDLVNRQLALQTAAAIKDQLQAPLISWLLRQQNIAYRLAIFDLLTPNNQLLIEQVLDNKNLVPLIQNRIYKLFARTNDPIAKKVILKLTAQGKQADLHKILFVKEYRALTGLGLKACKDAMDKALASLPQN